MLTETRKSRRRLGATPVRIVAYRYEHGMHCIECTRKKFHGADGPAMGCDDNGIPRRTPEGDNHPALPVWNSYEAIQESTACGTCGKEIGVTP
jgi:hypothetical protein